MIKEDKIKHKCPYCKMIYIKSYFNKTYLELLSLQFNPEKICFSCDRKKKWNRL